ncbi:3-oxoacyl-[acyl-carrier-protein] synthase 3 [Lachnospiraceae bacterium 2_1_46FAA]|nr:3-oxoacyl-[acyl-carrier-protein] synthase 3 [Lachnospiraceae bacterium 2_1_46FAA]
MIGKICGTGAYAPPNVMDNNDLSKLVETSDEWIRERTGIVRRHIADGENTVSMAVKSAESALKNANISAEEIGFIIVSTISSNVILPCAACEVQKEIGAVNAVCFDLNAACSGFLFAYNTAQAYIASGIYRTGIVIGAECLSNLIDWKDRGTCILFGDGAGAVVVKAKEGTQPSIITHSDGEKGKALTCEQNDFIHMDGQEVFKFAVKQVPKCICELLEANGLKKEEIHYFILHQANRRIVEAVAKRLKIEIEKFPMNLQEYGNTSSASIPILLDEMNQKGLLRKGMKIVMAGFGAGLSWGASLIEW